MILSIFGIQNLVNKIIETIGHPLFIPLIVCGWFFLETINTTFYGYYLMLAVAIFGYALGWLVLTHYNDIQKLNHNSKMRQRPFYIFKYRSIYMVLCIGFVGAINMHALIGPTFIINTPITEKAHRSGRSTYYTITVQPVNYPRLELRVKEKFWQEISIGQKVALTAQKNVLGLSVVDKYVHIAESHR